MSAIHKSSGPLILCAAVLLLAMAHTAGAATVGPVTDDLGVIRIAKGAPIQIGAYWVLSGADTALGLDEKRGVEIAFKELGGKVLDHPLKLNAEDDGCNAEGGQTAATKLAANPQTVIVLGPACSSAATPGAPILWQQGIVNICTACTAPALTAPTRKPEYAGFARTVFSDSEQGKADATYVHDVAKAQLGGHHPRRQPVRAAASAGVRRQLQAAGRQGAVAGGDRAQRRRHEAAADAHRQRQARPDLLPGVHRRRRADRAPGEGARRAWRRPR